MRHSISDTAEYGDYVTGKRIITDETKAAMKQVLAEIQDGTFAKNWILENQANRPAFNAMRRKGAEHPIEEVAKSARHDELDEKIISTHLRQSGLRPRDLLRINLGGL